jgi:hypothetical protein
MPGLSVNDVISVSATFSPLAVPTANFGALLIIGPTPVIPLAQRLQVFTSASSIGQVFGTTSPEFLAGENFFSQSPNPQFVYIGRWNQAASPAQLIGGVVKFSVSQLAGSGGTLSLTVNGTLVTSATINLTGASSYAAIAALVQAAFTSPPFTITWDPINTRFVITTTLTGATATISFATGVAASIGGVMGLMAVTGGTLSQGAALETPLACMNAMINISSAWYGCMFAPTNPGDLAIADHQAIAALIESTGGTSPRIYGVNVMDPNALLSSSVTDLPFLLSAANYDRTFSQYSSTDEYAIASLYGRGFTTNFTANNTVITLKFKTEPGVIAETLSEQQAAVLTAKNCNVFVNYSNGGAIIQQGNMASGLFFDEVQGVDWFCNALQTADWNLLTGSPTKIPQTDAGTIQLVNASESACIAAVNNGLVGPGVWGGPDIGTLKNGQTLANGYYVFAPLIASQNQGDRQSRVAVTRQVCVILAGAVHSTSILVNVQR